MEEKTKILKEKLFRKSESGWYTSPNLDEIFDYAEGYIDFLNHSKTEREAVKYFKQKLDENGFQDICEIETLTPGDKVYYINHHKNIYAAIIGSEDFKEGFNIIGAHIDSPRLDLKPNPLYEDTSLAMLKTHYYGGIKKYQWLNIPLSMHGVFIKKDGQKVEVNIGEDENDPIFTIADLLPHLSNWQEKKKLSEAIDPEKFNILVGSMPYTTEDEKDNVKLNVLSILNQKYGIVERDFVSSEIEFVPAFKARSLGFDRSMVAGYGQDDKACAYPSLTALLKQKNLTRTSICILADKEEVGSMGNTGMSSHNFEYFIQKLIEKTNTKASIHEIYKNTLVLSADVTAAYNPNYQDIYEKNNESYLGSGLSLIKYTGSASKGGASDANAEYIGFVRKMFEEKNIAYQNSEMGKIGVGGGGTISYILANRGMNVVDCGISLLSMHSPYEITSKFDLYNAYLGYQTFYQNAETFKD